MPRSLDEYTLRQWLRLRPVVERYKMGRYAARSACHVRRRAAAGNAAAVARGIKDRRLLISVAFDDPQLIRWQADLIRHRVRDCVYLIVDNSSDDQTAQRIEADALARGLCYLRFAGNPWSETEYSRSHGLAMSWAWHNVVRPGAPRAFGFIDHDLFPTEDTDPFAPLSQAPVWGHVLDRGRRWYLWAGFCFFRYDDVKTSNLDFRHDWYADLDTGGFNWHRLYRHLDRDKIPSIAARRVPALPGRPVKDACFDWLGPWLHECGSGVLPELKAEKRAVLARRHLPRCWRPPGRIIARPEPRAALVGRRVGQMKKKSVTVNDKMQRGYRYTLVEPAGRNFAPEFQPELTPAQMLKLGVFCGKYMTDCRREFPRSWFLGARLAEDKRDCSLNYFGVDASQKLAVWRRNGWIYRDDPRGWFQWYCRYYMGRRIPAEDARQIGRWKAMRRHVRQIERHCEPGDLGCRPRQRQALLHWAYDSRKI